jgi:hypothetical protein
MSNLYVNTDRLSIANRLGEALVNGMDEMTIDQVRSSLGNFLNSHSNAFGSTEVEEARNRFLLIATASDFDQSKYAWFAKELTEFMRMVDSAAAKSLGYDRHKRF